MKNASIVSTDPIADMLTRIRNGIAVDKQEVVLPHSKAKESVAKILADSGFIKSAKAVTEDKRKVLQLVIRDENEAPKITEIDRLSKPGRRVYVKAGEIPTIRRGRGMVVISTSQGVMSGSSAKAKRLGGELICKVY